MRILFVAPGYPPDIGGIESVVQQLSIEMSENGNQVYVLAASRSGFGVQKISKNLTVERLRSISPNNSYHLPIGLGRRLRALREEYDLVHAHGYHSFPALVSFLYRGNTPFFISCHYHRYSHKAFRNFLLKPYKTIASKMVNRSHCVFCVSGAEKSLVEEDFKPKSCKVIHNGVAYPEKIIDGSKNENRIVMIGRLEKYKNQEVAIRFLKKNNEYKLDLVGDGPDFQRLRKIVRNEELGDRVVFHGRVSEKDKNRIISRCSALLTLSEHESFGLVILEALSMGKPVMASDIPSHREIFEEVGDGVILVDQNNIEEIILKMHDIESYQGNVENEKIEKFRWGRIAEDYLRAYNEIL
tara:strand:+ start:1041 stop:2105 length:1065 start_codon:yes stop_codon:yes gene_type:complete